MASMTGTLSKDFTLEYGGYWTGTVHVNLGYTLYYGDGETLRAVVNSASFSHSDFGPSEPNTSPTEPNGFVDAFFFAQDTNFTLPSNTLVTAPENTSNIVSTILQPFVTNNVKVMSGFYHNNLTLESGQLTGDFTPYTVYPSGNEFKLISGVEAIQIPDGSNNYREFVWSATYDVAMPLYDVGAARVSNSWEIINNNGINQYRDGSGNWQRQPQENYATLGSPNVGHGRIRQGGNWNQLAPGN